MKPIPKFPRSDGFDAALFIASGWVLPHTCEASLTIHLNHVLSDIVKLRCAVAPSPVLSKVPIGTMPLINGIKALFPGNNNTIHACILAFSFNPPNNNPRFIISRNIDLLKEILVNIFVALLVFTTKFNKLIFLMASRQQPSINSHLPVLNNIRYVVKFILGSASKDRATL